ncbi:MULTISPECIES: hypothetical protein [Amycolatopsis]|uniref:PH domain-containing protein n=1 Tax=Amycolatopsis bullii TaxID=941987 RepID=A0ABQ3KH80_9PSEU|nr:hypothetical protein [Amycolatopsis bullii]GHG24322.1 hypothetical protein GCM10017567_49410 [Amycolatopsis bullii]
MTALPGSGRYSVYTGRVTNWPLVVIFGVVMMVPLLALAAMSRGGWLHSGNPTLALLAGAAAVLFTGLTGLSVRTTAGPNGVSVHCGAFGWPRRTYQLDDIERAEVTELSSVWNLMLGHYWTPRNTYFTVRTGPALRLVTRTGRTVTITVPDPAAVIAIVHEAKSA